MSPENFPRYGQVGASISHIFDIVFPSPTRGLEAHGFCHCPGGKSSLGFESNVQTLLIPLQAEKYGNRNVAYGVELDMHLKLLIDDMEAPYLQAARSCECGSYFSDLKLISISPPSILHFEVYNSDGLAILPSIQIKWPTHQGSTKYRLASIVYLGAFHFTCRIFANNVVWKYNGHIASGTPQRERYFSDDLWQS